MKNKNIVPIIGISVLVLFILANVVRGRGSGSSQSAPALPEITSEIQPMTLDEIQARFKRVFDETMSGRYAMAMDKEAGTLTVDQWSDGMNADVPNMALVSRDQLKKWNASLENLRSLGEDMQVQVSNHGHPEISVVWRLVNCDDLGQVFAVVERGVLTYDVVTDTPPGQTVPDPNSRVQPTDTVSELGTYVVNTGSRHFHREICSYAGQIASYNRAVFTGDRLDLIAQGFTPCAWCDP